MTPVSTKLLFLSYFHSDIVRLRTLRNIMITRCILVLVLVGQCFPKSVGPYSPTWESLDKRPLPGWYDDAKFGIFLHWGVYSVPGFGSEWFWSNWEGGDKTIEEFMKNTRAPGFTYQQFANEFSAEFFNATQWAEIFHSSKAKYIVLTSKHHEGFTMWPSTKAFSWNSKDVGPHRDIVKELSEAVREKKLTFGVYYSLYEWFNPMYLADKNRNFTTREYVDEKMLPELHELIENYRPEVLWTDGDWETEDTYWRSQDFLAWLYNESPVKDTVVANDRWGRDIPCHHGGFYTCTDRYNPGILQKHKWENCMTVDKVSWGYRKNANLADFKTLHELIKDLSSTVSCGGNLLMNVGPTKEGTIAPIFQDRLIGLGKWLDINGEAIFRTRPWVYQNDSLDGSVWYTSSKITTKKAGDERTVYAIVLQWPHDNLLKLADLSQRVRNNTVMTMLGEKEPLKWTEDESGLWIKFPDMAEVKSTLAWSIKITKVSSAYT